MPLPTFVKTLRLALGLAFKMQVGLGTTFSAVGDPGNPNPHLACYGRPMRDKNDLIIAHRGLPCRSSVLVCAPRTGKCVSAKVGDRGPFGKYKNGEWKAIADLSPAVRRKLGHNGLEPVVLLVR
jgi:hypothetical protein